jgi:hypothetical protein
MCRNPYCPECAPDPPESDEPDDFTWRRSPEPEPDHHPRRPNYARTDWYPPTCDKCGLPIHYEGVRWVHSSSCGLGPNHEGLCAP